MIGLFRSRKQEVETLRWALSKAEEGERSAKARADASEAEVARLKSTRVLYCSFCPKSQHEVRTLIAGPGHNLFICDECVSACAEIIAENRSRTCSS